MNHAVVYRHAFDAAHRLSLHPGPCSNVHGHRYAVELTVEGPLDAGGMVVDFAAVKQTFGGWIDDNWDHMLLLWVDDDFRHVVEGNAPVVQCTGHPTAEWMAAELLRVARDVCGLNATRCDVWETPTFGATATVEEEL